MTLRAATCLLLTIAVAASGCSAPADRVTQAPAKIEIDTLWRFTSDLLHRVGAVRLGSGRVVVGNNGSMNVLAVTPGTNAVVTIGRGGQGPGEFATITDVAVSGNSIFVLDALARTLQHFELGDGVRTRETRTFPEPLGTAERVFVEDGGGILTAFSSGSAAAGLVPDMAVTRDTLKLVYFGAISGDTTKLLTTYAGAEYFYGVNDKKQRWRAIAPFATNTFLDFSRVGVVTADGRSGTISIRDSAGQSRVVYDRMGAEPDYATDEDFRKIHERIEVRAARLPDPTEYRAMAEVSLKVLGPKPAKPYYDGVVSDGRNVLLRMYGSIGDTITHWTLHSIATGARQTFSLPATLRVSGLAADTLVAVSSDSLGVESVLLLRLRGMSDLPGGRN